MKKDITLRPLLPIQSQAIELMLLHQFNPDMPSSKITKHLKITKDTLEQWKKDELFQAAFAKKRELLRNRFDDLRLAQRRERVKELEKLYHTADPTLIEVRLKILREIRTEVGDNPSTKVELRAGVAHAHAVVQEAAMGVELPKRAESAADWTPTTPTPPMENE